MRRHGLAILAIPVGLALAVLSLPWVLVAMGYGMIGDEAVMDRVIASCPLYKWLDWVEL